MLDRIKVASPCSADWDLMKGDDQVRFCSQCEKNVYNLSAMPRERAEELLREKAGDLCARYYRRADGTILTEDCPVGLRARANRLRRRVEVALSAFAAFSGSAFAQQNAVFSGTVADPAGAVIPRAQVSIEDASHHKFTTQSDNEGRFKFDAQGGSYTLTITVPGFKTFKKENVVVGQAKSAEFRLEIGVIMGEVVIVDPVPDRRK